MKKRIIPLLLMLALVLAGCGSGGAVGTENARMRVVTTTYPIYLFTSALTRDVDGVVVERLYPVGERHEKISRCRCDRHERGGAGGLYG